MSKLHGDSCLSVCLSVFWALTHRGRWRRGMLLFSRPVSVCLFVYLYIYPIPRVCLLIFLSICLFFDFVLDP